MTGMAPSITDEELDIYEPCTEALWEASSSRAWRASFPWTQKPPRNPPLRGALSQALADERKFSKIPLLGRLIAEDLLRLVDAGLGSPRLLGDCSARVLLSRRLSLAQRKRTLRDDVAAVLVE